ncbi:MAG: phospho-N-acetylmuramoyl-pentapeptide-transferase [Anaerolineae bacterium]|nr:phospho-N-acetylmuramoyl-pentapeptide-transferase [Anaerolineae bacterium]
MLPWLGHSLESVFGPFRLFYSYLFLTGFGAALSALLTWLLLPRLWRHLPTDKGREYAIDAQQSVGKPVAAGAIFVPIFLFVGLLVVPFDWRYLAVLSCVSLSMLEGLWDDSSKTRGGLSELQLGLIDLAISLFGAIILCRFQPVEIWLPLFKQSLVLSPWLYILPATGLLWLTINATNCTDGVDGLSGSLSLMAFIYLGGILYGIVGHKDISQYLLVPHYVDGADWALLAFAMAGCLAGYLWYNAFPSKVLMGDAGSRPMGFLIGMLVLACGNPFLIFVVAGIVLVNGATGLLKVALLRFFKISIFKNVRYPLHDHMRKNLGWSPTQVLVRFMLLQAVGTPILLVLLFKVR